jgi:hypothetical protein
MREGKGRIDRNLKRIQRNKPGLIDGPKELRLGVQDVTGPGG